MFNKLKEFIRRIFRRDRYVVPPEEEGGYIVPKIWAIDGERVAKREIYLRTMLGWLLGPWPKYLKGFQKILEGE